MKFSNRIGLEALWETAASDGASCPVGPGSSHDGAEIQQILDAWSLERSRSIETSLLLDLSRKLLERVLSGGPLSDDERRMARTLIRAIGQSNRD